MFFACSLAACVALVSQAERPFTWDARAAEHLLNRAAFGATTEEVQAAVTAGQAATIEKLCAAQPIAGDADRPLAPPDLPGVLVRPEDLHARVEIRRANRIQLQSDRIAPLGIAGAHWFTRMIQEGDPLRERMTLFWHGHLVTSFMEVGDPHDMLAQLEFLRANALGRFDVLLRGTARDPAMLQYLNNARNVKGDPNENWARELMELFTLGDGHYSEDDVKEVARAFTGWSMDRGHFIFQRVDHDFGQKTVLGLTGMLDGDDVIDRILAEPACARFLAGKLITFFEGRAPDEARWDAYAAELRASGYEIEPFLRRLFADRAFYRDEVVATRVASPVEYVAGVARRLGISPPGEMAVAGATVLGQRLYYPPSVQGWPRGQSWITTGSLMQRSNVAGALLGLVEVASILHDPELQGATPPSQAWKHPPADQNQVLTSGFPMLRWVQYEGWRPEPGLGERLARLLPEPKPSDAQIVDAALGAWLAVPASAGTHDYLVRFLRDERDRIKLGPSGLLRGSAEAEELLRRLAHLIESLPEAQLE